MSADEMSRNNEDWMDRHDALMRLPREERLRELAEQIGAVLDRSVEWVEGLPATEGARGEMYPFGYAATVEIHTIRLRAWMDLLDAEHRVVRHDH